MNEVTHKTSYTSASAFPVKTAICREVLESIEKYGIIPPHHIQMNPTNVCNLNCPFCSCAGRNKKEVLPIAKIAEIISKMAHEGAKAITITGGGEPLLHPDINDIFRIIYANRIEIGLVTNGTQFDRIDKNLLNEVTWCRISHADFREFTDEYYDYLHDVIVSAPDVDWAFSIVVSGDDNPDKLRNVADAIQFANDHDFTHVRIVPDLYNAKEIDLDLYRQYFKAHRIKDRTVIYQPRQDATPGQDCYLAFLKPYIDADGYIYPCCGVQYALDGDYRFMTPELRIGDIDEFIEQMHNGKKPFNGNICKTCYYKGYNDFLGMMMGKVAHRSFL